MRLRQGFVSNSSSSSFICDVCGENYSGWDATLDQAEMFECTNNHTICLSHAVGNFEDEEENEDFPHYVDKKHCPMCTFVSLEETSAFNYLLKESGKTRETLLKEIKDRFDNYDKFREYIL